jgi:integrase
MVTFKIEPGKAKRDGSIPIYIRVTKDREYKRIRFFLDASAKDITANGEIKDARLDIALNETINGYKHQLLDAGAKTEEWSAEKVADYLTASKEKEEVFNLDFFEFGEWQINRLVSEGREGTAKNYSVALNNFEKFIGERKIDINSITKTLLQDYQAWFKENGYGDRAWELYCGSLKTLHNWAKAKYNDEDDEKLNIKLSPFKTIEYKIPAAKKREIVKRAISATALRYLWNVPENRLTERAQNARDAYFLSFALCGMNAVDMWHHKMSEDSPEDLIEYYRAKTVGRSGNDSYIRVHVHKMVMPIHRRHRDKRGFKTWDYGRYSSSQQFNCALSLGMKAWVDAAVAYYGGLWNMDADTQRSKILKKLELPTDGLDFYSARHSFATIAANDCGVSTDIIDRCLCHAVSSVAANSYIKKDYRYTDETVEKVMEFVFGDYSK